MILEAATQVVEIEGRDSDEVEYYDIRDVSLSKALIVPEDDRGIETIFALRPASLNSVSRHQWVFEVVLTSVSTEEGQDTFSEHCRGLVEIGFEKYGKFSCFPYPTVRSKSYFYFFPRLSRESGRERHMCCFLGQEDYQRCAVV